MTLFNPTLMTQVVPYLLLVCTGWGLAFGLVVGGVIGVIAGIAQRRVQATLGAAIAGSFLGTLVVGILPILAYPGLVVGWPHDGLLVLVMGGLSMPMGSIGGALVGIRSRSLWRPKNQRQRNQVLASVLVATYLVMGLVSYTSSTMHCNHRHRRPSLCRELGFPVSSRPSSLQQTVLRSS